jgi:serine-type D-Ala-D-Ala carboxypeptidase (penicillin-binding protein 5/6)
MAPIYFLRLFVVLGLGVAPMRAAQTVAFLVSDNTTGFVLDSSGSTKKVQIGSLTKIATAMVVLDWTEATKSDVGQRATVPATAAGLTSASDGIGLQPGDSATLRDLLYAALLQSDNQAAETLADHVGHALGGAQAVEEFVGQMNALASRLHMTRTRFLNPHGIDGLERALPYSTAEDLAKLTQYAMQNAAFRFYVSQKERKIAIGTAGGEESQYLLRNTNELVGVSGIDGVKTGQTKRAGGCVVLSAARAPITEQQEGKVSIAPRRLNVIVLGSDDRFGVASGLLQRGWQLYDRWAAAGRPPKWKAPR